MSFSEENACEHCLYWRGGEEPAYGKRAGTMLLIGQCVNEYSDLAPFATLESGDAFVFTPASACCLGFEPHPDHAGQPGAERPLAHGRNSDRQRV